MSTGSMPNPPDHLSTQATGADTKGQDAGATTAAAAAASAPAPAAPSASPTSAPEAAAPAPAPAAATSAGASTPSQPAAEAPAPTEVPLGADMARIIVEQADVIAQQMVYHSQQMMGVSALGTDPVNARNAALIVAAALRHDSPDTIQNALINLGNAQISQVNDRTLPYKLNSQVAGLFEGIVLDTITRQYRDDAGRVREARALLEEIFQRANEQANMQPKSALSIQAAGGPPPAHYQRAPGRN